MNRITLIGNLTKDPELSNTSSGISVCRFTVAVARRFAGDRGGDRGIVPGGAAAGLGTYRLHGDHHPCPFAVDFPASALSDGGSPAGPGRRGDFLER